MTYSYSPAPVVSAVNSNTTPLSAGATFTGTWEECWADSSITIIAVSDVAGTLYADFSTDGSNVDRAVQLTSGTSTDLGIHSLTAVAKYMRVRLVNGASNQTYLRLQTILNPEARIALPTSRLAQNLGDYSDVLNTRAALVGRTDGGGYWSPISASGEGHIEVGVFEPSTAFGEVAVAEPTPVAQVDYVYGLNTLLTRSANTGSGSVTASSGLCVVATGAATSSSATLTSRRYMKYRPGQGALCRLTGIFTAGAANSKQYVGVGAPDLTDGFFFGFNGTSFGICHIKNGSESWTPQAEWTEDIMDGNDGATNKSGMLLDTTKGNVFQIKYQYLGFGNIYFYIENPDNGQFVLVHIIKYANANTVPSLRNPSMYLLWAAANTTNNTNIVVKGASGALFLEGHRTLLGPKRGTNNTKTGVTTAVNAMLVKNCTTYNSVTNRAQIRLRSIGFAASTTGSNPNGIITLKMYLNPTVGGSPSFTPIEGSTADAGVTLTSALSVASVDTAGTMSGGSIIYNAVLTMQGNLLENLEALDIFLNPGDVLGITVESTNSCSAAVALTWIEDL